MNLFQEVEIKRKELFLLSKDKMLTDPLVIKASQELDEIIAMCQMMNKDIYTKDRRSS
ncbi:aspartyl-phosphate phosphatase Spo0E family protein [Bacillus sp. MMSF_3328]|uniref:aspartyl-phosphate phosphatase Spo0E family protein n=1 Tax=Bacillus sp. MMSF_3328 TaxID=3047080 RepID=UPI00273EB8B3|nr:aspartyl-phosphate phosphatase Spo0E family protein [Bacillus sp. MMSF_3328]